MDMDMQSTNRDEDFFVKFCFCPICAGELQEVRHEGWDAPDAYQPYFGYWVTYLCPQGHRWTESWDSCEQDQRLTHVTAQRAIHDPRWQPSANAEARAPDA